MPEAEHGGATVRDQGLGAGQTGGPDAPSPLFAHPHQLLGQVQGVLHQVATRGALCPPPDPKRMLTILGSQPATGAQHPQLPPKTEPPSVSSGDQGPQLLPHTHLLLPQLLGVRASLSPGESAKTAVASAPALPYQPCCPHPSSQSPPPLTGCRAGQSCPHNSHPGPTPPPLRLEPSPHPGTAPRGRGHSDLPHTQCTYSYSPSKVVPSQAQQREPPTLPSPWYL